MIDSGQAIAARVRQLLMLHQLTAPNDQTTSTVQLLFHASKLDDHTKPLVQRLIGEDFFMASL